jgi:hypothetical protein
MRGRGRGTGDSTASGKEMTTFQIISMLLLGSAMAAGLAIEVSFKECAELVFLAALMVCLYALVLLVTRLLFPPGGFGLEDYVLLRQFAPGALPLYLCYLLVSVATGGLLRSLLGRVKRD